MMTMLTSEASRPVELLRRGVGPNRGASALSWADPSKRGVAPKRNAAIVARGPQPGHSATTGASRFGSSTPTHFRRRGEALHPGTL
jgi:hypothetical protein